MTAKKQLKMVYEAHTKITVLNEQIARLRDDMTSVRGNKLQEKVQTSQMNDPMGTLVARKLDKISHCEAELAKHIKMMMDAEDMIDRIAHQQAREVLRWRYILHKDYVEIAKGLGYSVSRSFALHKKGLDLLKVENMK